MRLLLLMTILLSVTARAQTWEVIENPEQLKELFSDTEMEVTLKDGVKATAKYGSDGNGIVRAWGETYKRKWEVRGNDQVCMRNNTEELCYRIERNLDNDEEYRAENLETGDIIHVMITMDETLAVVDGDDKSKGGAAKPSAEEIAAALANPNTPMASMTFKLQTRTFQGDLPNANDQDSTTLLFQPSFPFVTEAGDTVFFRPAIPVLFDQPAFNAANQDFDTESGLGDIAFDLAYGRTTESGILWAGGIISSLPTATEDSLGTDLYTLGPEFLIGKLTPKWVLGAFPNHQWDIGGSGNGDINLTTLQLFGTVLPGGGWNYATSPILTYDWNSEQWTIPLNFNFGKTIIRKGRPWKLSAEINYYIEQSDPFGPEWMIGFNIAPVVKNVMSGWFK